MCLGHGAEDINNLTLQLHFSVDMFIPAIHLEYLKSASIVLVGSREPGDHVINISAIT